MGHLESIKFVMASHLKKKCSLPSVHYHQFLKPSIPNSFNTSKPAQRRKMKPSFMIYPSYCISQPTCSYSIKQTKHSDGPSVLSSNRGIKPRRFLYETFNHKHFQILLKFFKNVSSNCMGVVLHPDC